MVAPGGTSHRFPASHIPLLPLWGCLCPPPSLPPPLPTLGLEAAHRTERGRLCHIPEGCSFHGREPHPGAPRCPTSHSQHWNCFNTGALSERQTLEFALERKAVPGPTGSRTLELLFLLLGPGPLPTDFPETPGPANGHVPLGTTGEGAASTSSPLFFVLLNPMSVWDIQVWMDKTPTQAAAEAMPCLGTLVPKPGVTNDRDSPTSGVVGSVFIRLEAACAELPGRFWSQCQPLPRCAALAKPGVPCGAKLSP